MELARYNVTKWHSTAKIVRYSEDPVITNYLVNSKNIRYSTVIKKVTITKNSILHVENIICIHLVLYTVGGGGVKALTIKTSNSKTLAIKARCDSYSNLSFLLTAACERQSIRYSGVNCVLGPSKSIRYSGVPLYLGLFSRWGLIV